MEQEENKKQETPDLGQFKSVEALLEAYRTLQAEFTRRSQRLKELEAPNDEALYEAVKANDKVRGKIIEEYLTSIGRSPLVNVEGTGIATSPKKPRSVKEAGQMAIQYLKGV